MYGIDAPWIWRGQANETFLIEPGVHTRVKRTTELNDDAVVAETERLIEAARTARLDMHEGVTLPDMALLAMLQHHGAATPLLDVSLDPMIALYMAVVSPSPKDSESDGVLFAIARPDVSIPAFDARPFRDVYESLPPDSVVMYTAPDVSERLRIQRGHFLIGRCNANSPKTTIPLTVPKGAISNSWLDKRLKRRGKQGKVVLADTDVGVFRVASNFKKPIQDWLEVRTGISPDFVFPTPWHQPHLGTFAASHGRK